MTETCQMSVDRSETIKLVFGSALALSPEERQQFLVDACEGDEALRQEVLRLLAEHDRTGEFRLGTPPIDRTTNEASVRPDATVQGQHFGPYRVLRVLGEGGMGTVYLAEQREPIHRRVALKVIKLGMDSREIVARFESERQALALMDHPNIARVFDAGTSEVGRPYFVMEYVPGVPITDYCDQHRLTSRDRLALFCQVCEAIHHAHQKGVIHRDLKPSNILVEVLDGKPVPKVIDFGVAKAISQRLTEKTLFTEIGALIGTPAYMSPEQAAVTALDVDIRSDIYSLGVVLYELLVGAVPFNPGDLRRAGYEEICRIIREEEPPKLTTKLHSLGGTGTEIAKRRHTDIRALVQQVQGDLEWITLKTLEKDRTRRYPSASELAADVVRHLTDEPVMASPPGTLYRLRKFRRKHRGAVAAVLTVLLVLLAGLAVSSTMYLRSERQRLVATTRELVAYADESLSEDPERSVILSMFAVSTSLHRAPAALASAENALHAAVLSSHVRRTFRGHAGTVRSVAPSPDGKYLVTADTGTVKVWDLTSGQELQTLREDQGFITSVAISPDGKWLATGSEDGKARIWDWAAGRELFILGNAELSTEKQVFINDVAFSPDGKFLATAGDKGNVRSGASGRVLTNAHGSVKIWNAGTGRELLNLDHGGESVAFSPDGTRVASVDHSGVRMWDPLSGRELLTLASRNSLSFVAFSPDSERFATAGDDEMARVWDTASGRELLTLRGHQGVVQRVAFSPDAKWIATGSLDGAARVWDSISGREQLTLRGSVGHIESLAFTADGRQLVTAAGGDQVAKLWDLGFGQELYTLDGHDGHVFGLTFSPDGRRLATTSESGVNIWDATSGKALATGRSSAGRPYSVAFSPDGKRLVGGGNDTAKLWDAATGRELMTMHGRMGPVWGVAFSPDGKRIATGCEDGSVKVWDANSGSELLTLRGHSQPVWWVAFSPDGKRLASAAMLEFAAKVWDSISGRKLLTLSAHGGIAGVAFAPDGKRIAIGVGNTAQIWDSISGRELLTFPGHPNTVWGVAFSPDGTRVATASADGAAKVWDADSGQELLSLHGHQSLVRNVAFSPDGKRLATASDDQTVQIYALDISDLLKLARTRVTRDLRPEECKKYLHTSSCPPLP